MKLYCKNERSFVYAIFTEQDIDRAIPILQKISEYGISLWFSNQFSKKEIRRIEAAYSCILFISKKSLQDEKVRHCIEYAEKYNKKILCIYLEPTTLSSGLELQLNSLQSVNIDDFPDEQAFLDKLKSAEVFSEMCITVAQKRFARRRGLTSVFIPLAAAIVIFFTVVVPLLLAPIVQAGTLRNLGIGNLDVAKLEHLYVVGSAPLEQWTFAYNKDEKNVVTDNNLIIPKGDYRDISFLALLKNAREIAFEGNQVSDVSPLCKIKTLERLTLNCNPVKSIRGMEALQNLKEIYLEFTDVRDISPLFKIPSLKRVSFENTYVSSIEGIENLKGLLELHTGNSNLTDISPLDKMDFSYINNSEGFSFEAQNSIIKDFTPLEGIPKFNEIKIDSVRIDKILMPIGNKPVSTLYIAGSDIKSISQLDSIKDINTLCLKRSFQLVSIEGIANYSELKELNLVDCANLSDLTPLLNLPSLKRLIICPEMKDLTAKLTGATFEVVYQDCEKPLQGDVPVSPGGPSVSSTGNLTPTPTSTPTSTPTPAKVIKVAVASDYPLKELSEDNISLALFGNDLANAIGEKMGVTLEFEQVAFDGIFDGLNQGTYDCIFALAITPDRYKSYDFSTPYLVTSQLVVTKPGDTSITSVADLANKKVGVWEGTAADTACTKLLETVDFELLRYADVTGVFGMMYAGQLDLIVADSVTATDYQAKSPEKYAITGVHLADEPVGICFKKGNPLRDEMQKALDKLRAEGKLSELSKTWFGGYDFTGNTGTSN